MTFVIALTLAAALADPQGPLSVEESLQQFQLPDGLVIEAVAAEPLVADPVAITFDEHGRMFAVEYGDYPVGAGEGKPGASRIRQFEDFDGDGRMDRSTIFADGLSFAQGLLAMNGGILVTNAPDVLFLKDVDGDGKAEIKEVLFSGFKPGNPQLRTAHPRYGLDNWITMTNGLSGGQVASAKTPDKKISIERDDFRFNPRTMDYEPATGLGQFGNTFDDLGHRFSCSNRNPVIASIIPYRALRRNQFFLLTKGYDDVAPVGGDAKVYPLVSTSTTAFSHTGTHTAACGVTVYRGDLLGDAYLGDIFVCEPTGHLVTQSKLKSKGSIFQAERARPNVEFLASTDTWFRPVSLADGPDGALYVVDMYRAVIEHPQYMTELPKKYVDSLDFRAGSDRGRIYRIKPANRQARPYVPPKTVEEMVALLDDQNGWRRQVGQRLLVERKAIEAVDQLKTLAKTGKNPLARIHVLWTLEGLDSLDVESVAAALGDADERVREQGSILAGCFVKDASSLLDQLEARTRSDGDHVLLQVALALGETDDPRATNILASIAAKRPQDAWIAAAVLTSSPRRSGQLIDFLVRDRDFTDAAGAARRALIVQLAGVVGARGDEIELAKAFELVGAESVKGSTAVGWWRSAILAGLADGLSRHRGRLGRTSLGALLAKRPDSLAAALVPVSRLIDRSAAIAVDPSMRMEDRIAAIGLLAYQPFVKVRPTLDTLLEPGQPSEAQIAAIDAVRTLNDESAAELLLAKWAALGPSVRAGALEWLLRRSATTHKLLRAMEQGLVNPSVINLDQRTNLTRHGEAEIKSLAVKLFGAVSSDRREVIERYQPALTQAGDRARGEKVFRRVCLVCHKLDGEGNEVGPDISDVRNKTKEVLMGDVLDPNRAVEPRWTEYVVVTTDGMVVSGILVSETAEAVVLRRAEGKQDIIPRDTIETISSSGKSLMPEGVEKDVTVDEFADLLAYLTSRSNMPVSQPIN